MSSWLHSCSYNPLIRPLSRVSQVMVGFQVDVQPSCKYPGRLSRVLCVCTVVVVILSSHIVIEDLVP